jgi:hypothetical protein
MLWCPKTICEKDEKASFPNSYKYVTKYPHPFPWFLYRTYRGAIERLGFIDCEGCEKWFRKDQMHSNEYCERCHEHRFCECGQRLEDAYGSPGDGFCVRCR